jgi:hypothetical protein
MSGPSPLPWIALKYGHIVDPCAWSICACLGEDKEANAAFIVEAVNSHADLLEALEALKAVLAQGKPLPTPECQALYDRCVAAVAKAEGTPHERGNREKENTPFPGHGYGHKDGYEPTAKRERETGK